MDRASAICIVYPVYCPHLGNARASKSWANRFPHRRPLLANKPWTDRKRANDRDRSNLLLALRLCGYSMVGILGAKALTLAYLHRALDLPWLGLTRQRSKSCPVLLSYPWRRSLAKSPPPRPNSPRTLHRSNDSAGNFCCLGHSILSGVTLSLAFASLVRTSGGRISWRRRPIGGLVTKLPSWLRLSTSLDTTGPIYSIE